MLPSEIAMAKGSRRRGNSEDSRSRKLTRPCHHAGKVSHSLGHHISKDWHEYCPSMSPSISMLKALLESEPFLMDLRDNRAGGRGRRSRSADGGAGRGVGGGGGERARKTPSSAVAHSGGEASSFFSAERRKRGGRSTRDSSCCINNNREGRGSGENSWGGSHRSRRKEAAAAAANYFERPPPPPSLSLPSSPLAAHEFESKNRRQSRRGRNTNRSGMPQPPPPPPPPPQRCSSPRVRTLGRDQRSHSCVSSDGSSGLAYGSGCRRPSAISVGGLGLVAPGQKAYLIRQKSTGEEVVVTMSSVRSPIVGARTVVNRVPTFVASARFVPAVPTGSRCGSSHGLHQHQQQRRFSSFDDQDVNYNSMMTRSDHDKRFSEMVSAQDVIAANRLEKAYQQYRRQAHAASDETMAPSALEDRLSEWLKEKNQRRRQSCAVGEFASQVAAGSRSPYFAGRTGRAHSFGLVLPAARSTSKGSIGSGKQYGERGTRSQRTRHRPLPNSASGSEAALPSDIEAAAARLYSGLDDVDILDMKAPPEKERRRMALIVSCVALAITFFAASLVGLTLGLSQLLESFSSADEGGLECG